MKKIILAFAVSFLCVFFLPAREYTVHGPQGGLSMKIALPEGFDPATGRCPDGQFLPFSLCRLKRRCRDSKSSGSH